MNGATPQNTKCCTDENCFRAATFGVLRCWVDKETCELGWLLHSRLVDATAYEMRLGKWVSCDPETHKRQFEAAVVALEDNLPCLRCRAAAIPTGLRLGKLERFLLLEAPRPEAKEGLAVKGSTRAETEALLRAARKLWKASLLFRGWAEEEKQTKQRYRPNWWFDKETGQWVCYGGGSVRRKYRHRVVWRTALGQAVVDCLGDKLRGRERIRWKVYQAEIISRCRLDLRGLVKLLHENVKRQLSWRSEEAHLWARLGNHSAYSEASKQIEALNFLRKAIEQDPAASVDEQGR